MKRNTIDLVHPNGALLELIKDFSQILPLDANLLIPPDRSKENRQIPAIDFEIYKKIWLHPLLYTFPHLAIHQAVLDELVAPGVFRFIDEHIQSSRLILLSDDELSVEEEQYRRTVEGAISRYTNYDPSMDNSADRGEVKSLAHIATRGLLYFCSHDSNALRLVEDAEQLETHLDTVGTLRYYEIIYYLVAMRMVKPDSLKNFYKYIYRLTTREKQMNPEWSQFLVGMDMLYREAIDASHGKPTPMY